MRVKFKGTNVSDVNILSTPMTSMNGKWRMEYGRIDREYSKQFIDYLFAEDSVEVVDVTTSHGVELYWIKVPDNIRQYETFSARSVPAVMFTTVTEEEESVASTQVIGRATFSLNPDGTVSVTDRFPDNHVEIVPSAPDNLTKDKPVTVQSIIRKYPLLSAHLYD